MQSPRYDQSAPAPSTPLYPPLSPSIPLYPCVLYTTKALGDEEETLELEHARVGQVQLEGKGEGEWIEGENRLGFTYMRENVQRIRAE